MLWAGFGLLCLSSFLTVAQQNHLSKITPSYAAEPTPSGGSSEWVPLFPWEPWDGGYGGDEGGRGLFCLMEAAPSRKAGARCPRPAAAGASAASCCNPGTEGFGGATTTLVGCITPTPAMPLEREPVNSVPLKRGIKHTSLIRG